MPPKTTPAHLADAGGPSLIPIGYYVSTHCRIGETVAVRQVRRGGSNGTRR